MSESPKSAKNLKPVLDNSKFPKKIELGFVENHLLPLGAVLMIGLFGYAAVKEALDPKKNMAVLSLSSMYTLLGISSLFSHRYMKNSLESRFESEAQNHIVENAVHTFEKENGFGYYSDSYSKSSYFENPLYPNADIDFWETYNKVAPIDILLEDNIKSGIKLEMLSPVEFMQIIRQLFMKSLNVKHDDVKFSPHSKGFGPGKFRLKVENIPVITDLPTGQVKYLSSAKGFDLPEKRGVYCNGKAYLSGQMKYRFMEEYKKITTKLEEPIREYLNQKFKSIEWDILITYKPKVINGDKEIPEGDQHYIQRVEMDVVINLVQKIPAEKVNELEKYFTKKA